MTKEPKNSPFSLRLRLLFLSIRSENIATATSQLSHNFQDTLVEILLAFIAAAKRMKNHSILDEQDPSAKAGRVGIMGHH